MKTFLFHTESHKDLLDGLLTPSLPDYLELIVHSGPQSCPSASFMEQGWMDCIRNKVIMTIDAIADNEGDCMHADIQFFTRHQESLLPRQLVDCDLVAQSDSMGDRTGILGGGFFASRCCAVTKTSSSSFLT